MHREPGEVVGGVDTHLDIHVAAIIDHIGQILATQSFRPDRQRRRRRGKSDTTDAEAAARAVLSGDASAVPKTGDGQVEGLRALRIARRSGLKARTQTALQIRDLILTAPAALRGKLEQLETPGRAERCARFRCGDPTDPLQAIKRALRILGRRYEQLSEEIAELDTLIAELCAQINPALLGAKGIGPEVAATLLVIAGDNPERLRSDAALAALCGASPIEASSGRIVRHRLNRGGNREGNNALWRIVMVRMATCPTTKTYVARRTAQGRSKKEIIRCLQRYVAREIHSLLVKDHVVITGAELKARRSRTNQSLSQAATALNTWPIKLSRLERGLDHDTEMAARYHAWLQAA